MTRSLRSSLRSSPLAVVTVAALAFWGCGGGDSPPADGGGGSKIDGGGGSGNAGRGGSGGGAAGRGGSGGSTAGTTGGSTAGTGGGTAGTTGGTGGGTAGSTAGTGGGSAGRGGTGGSSTAGTGGSSTAGTGGSSTAGTGGSSTAGTGGSSTAGTGGSSTAGTGGSSTAGTGGSSTAGTGGSSTAGTGGSSTAGTGGTTPACTNGASCALSGTGGSALNGVCANGVCTNCGADSTCQTAYGANHICLGTGATANCVDGDCHQNSECAGKICSATTNFCTNCSGDPACVTAFGANHLCVNGTCIAGNCRNNGECASGQICNASSQCVSCGGVDSACVASYGSGYICVSNSCVTGTCHDNSECTGGQICNASHVCAGCGTDDAICGSGRICVGALCVAGNCHTNNNCSNGQVCLGNSCAACAQDNQCGSGQLCLSGGCTTGNCRIATDCAAGQICTANNCAACATDNACLSGYGPNHLCSAGACISGNCRAAGDCSAAGTICNTGTLFCGACTTDNQCATEYAGAYICNGGVCVAGNCHSTANCSNGQVCNLGNHTCEGCGTSDATCADAANYGPNHVCQGNACVTGNCHVTADCSNPQQTCNGLTCGNCSNTPQCVAERGANHVCVAGACLSGNCNTSADCASSNQLCNTTTHSCEACATDGQCTGDTQYGAMHICLGTGSAAKCVAGNCHDTSADCTGGQICGIGTAHVCGSCSGSDTACKNDGVYTSGSICLSGGCVTGDCHDTSTECAAGKICGASTAHTCGNCIAGTPGDTQCVNDARYGSGNICFQGLCGVGNCHASSGDCTGANAGLICSASSANVCGTCSSDSACTSDTFYGANTICNTAVGVNQGKCVTRGCGNNNSACLANSGDFCCGGSCTPGNCCVDADCGAIGTACINHTCSACNAVSGNTFYVDPVNGNDSTGTGSNMSGAASAPGCAFKTITRAIAILGASPPAGTKIVLVGAGATPRGLAAGDALPLTIPTNTTLTTTGGPITVTLATTAQGTAAGFRLNNNASAISGDPAAPLVLDGNNFNAGIGVLVQPGSAAFTSSISNVTIRNTNGDGIRVTAGTLTVGAGVVQTASNQDGLRVSGGTANVNNAAGTQTSFGSNAQHGIETSGNGTVTITATRGAPVPSNNGTVVLSFNTQAGLRIGPNAFGSGGTAGLNDINGVVAWGNTNRDMIVLGGSKFRLRNSVLGSGPEGIRVNNNAGNTDAGNDISQIDMGTAVSFGNNYIQMPNGSLGFHTNAGICVNLQGGHPAQNLFAAGNFMTTAGNPGTQVSCATTAATVAKGANCNTNARWSVGNATGATTPITNVLNMCN